MFFSAVAGYDFNKAFWSCWPRNAGKVESLRDRGKRTVSFELCSSATPVSFYTRGTGNAGELCRLDMEFECSDLQLTAGSQAKLKISFQNETKRPGSAGEVTQNLSLVNGRNRISYSFTVPQGTVDYQISMVLTGISGKITVTGCRVQSIVTQAVITPVAGENPATRYLTATGINGFFRYGSAYPAGADSTVFLTYDRENLYVKVVCMESRLDLLRTGATEFDGEVYLDDSVEIFLANGDRVWQLVMNSAAVRCDGELKISIPGDPRRFDKSWNGSWQGRSEKGDNFWSAEFVIPWTDLDFSIRSGAVLRLNILRNCRTSGREQTQLDCRFGMPGNDAHFSKIVFRENDALFTRSVMDMDGDALAVIRQKREFEKVPRRDGHYPVIGPGCDIYLERYSRGFAAQHREVWPQRTMQIIEAMQSNGMIVPAWHPWVVPHLGGRENYETILAAYPDIKFGLAVHNSSHDRAVIGRGTNYFNGTLSNIGDENLERCVAEFLEKFLKDNPEELARIVFVRGFDEPTNSLISCFSYQLNPENQAALRALNELIRQNYGYGKYGMPDLNRGMTDPDDGLRHIAFCRWWNDRASAAFTRLHDILKRHAPQIPFMPLVCNTVAAYSGYEELPLLARSGEWIGVDPYPTSTYSLFSSERALYHTGFCTKLAHDLAAPAKIFVYVQAFRYHGQSPSAANLNEWVSQALKNGADILSFYASRNLEECPEIYPQVLHLSKLVTSMKALALPEKSPVAILYNYVGNWGRFDRGQMDYYSLYSVFAEKIKGDFAFISDRQLMEDKKVPAHVKICFAPALEYVDKDVAAALENFVRDGGTLVIFDPEAFRIAPDGEPVAQRESLLGDPVTTAIPAAGFIYFGAGRKPLRIFADNGATCRAVVPPDDAEVEAVWANGRCAAYRRQVGKGKVIYFAVNPFANADAALQAGNWVEYFYNFFRENGVRRGMMIWDFVLPEN